MSFDETVALVWAAGVVAWAAAGVVVVVAGKVPPAAVAGIKRRPVGFTLIAALLLACWPLLPLLVLRQRRLSRKAG